MHLVMSYSVCVTISVLFFQLHPQQCHMGLGADKKQVRYKNIIQSGTFISYTSTRLSLL